MLSFLVLVFLCFSLWHSFHIYLLNILCIMKRFLIRLLHNEVEYRLFQGYKYLRLHYHLNIIFKLHWIIHVLFLSLEELILFQLCLHQLYNWSMLPKYHLTLIHWLNVYNLLLRYLLNSNQLILFSIKFILFLRILRVHILLLTLMLFLYYLFTYLQTILHCFQFFHLF